MKRFVNTYVFQQKISFVSTTPKLENTSIRVRIRVRKIV